MSFNKQALTVVLCLTSILVFGKTSQATILTFDLENSARVDDGYGSRVTSASNQFGSYLRGSGFTPNIAVSYRSVDLSTGETGTAHLRQWEANYGDLVNVLYTPEPLGFAGEITLRADPGHSVTLHSFELGGWSRRNFQSQPILVLDGRGNVLRDLSGMVLGEGNQHSHFSANVTSDTIVIRYGDNWNIGIDNVNFSQLGNPEGKRTESDFNGDGISDRVVYRPNEARYYLQLSTGETKVVDWGSAQHKAIYADVDGDNTDDLGLSLEVNGSLFYYFMKSSDGLVAQYLWGESGDKVVLADYDGDGRDDIAIWRPGNGTWYINFQSGAIAVIPWGLFGDVPVPGDYDGDGIDDLAVWRPANGTWYIINSSNSSVAIRQWGLNEDVPLVADWNGDNRDDLAVWRPSNGTWYLRSLDRSLLEVIQWGIGAFGDIPRVGDFNGDNITDVSVFRPHEGGWYHNFRNGLSEFRQWGLPIDTVSQRICQRSVP